MTAIKTKTEKYIEVVGRRKTSVARVRLSPASKTVFFINDKDIAGYFVTEELRTVVERPIKLAEGEGKVHISAHVKGGGIHSQAEAVAHGISRALSLANPESRKVLKKDGMLTRDARKKERRKFGLKKARKAPQWSKR